MPLTQKERTARVWTGTAEIGRYADAQVGLLYHEWLWYVFHVVHHQALHQQAFHQAHEELPLAPLPEVA